MFFSFLLLLLGVKNRVAEHSEEQNFSGRSLIVCGTALTGLLQFAQSSMVSPYLIVVSLTVSRDMKPHAGQWYSRTVS